MDTKTREGKIEKIYEVIADKTLSFGCVFQTIDWTKVIALWSDGYMSNTAYVYGQYKGGTSSCDFKKSKIKKIIGHPVRIGDILHWIDQNTPDSKKTNGLFNLYKKIQETIDDQSDECIDFIYSLIEND